MCVCVSRVCLSTPSQSRAEDSSGPGIAFLNVGEGLGAKHSDRNYRVKSSNVTDSQENQ